MSVAFNPYHGLIIVPAVIDGPTGSGVLQLALDTGATSTIVNLALLVALGYNPGQSLSQTQITTGSGTAYAPRLMVNRIKTLGKEELSFPVLGHTLPPGAGVDGLLGLDYLRGHLLTIDFQSGQVDLS